MHLAAVNSESEVESAITILLESGITPTIKQVRDLLDSKSQQKVVVHVDQPTVKQYDSLLELVA